MSWFARARWQFVKLSMWDLSHTGQRMDGVWSHLLTGDTSDTRFDEMDDRASKYILTAIFPM